MIYYAILGVRFNSFTEKPIEFVTLKKSEFLPSFSSLVDFAKLNPDYDEYQTVKYEPIDKDDSPSHIELLVIKPEMIKLMYDEN